MADYFINAEYGFEVEWLVSRVYKLVCRSDFSEPGFALVRLPDGSTSIDQRKLIVDLKEGISNLLMAERSQQLGWFNMTRFDQKTTTKPHRDGAPNESLLILGYEPTKVHSELSMADYSSCAYNLGLTPDQFLEEFNPMYEKGMDQLAPYVTPLNKFDASAFQILIVNNSSNPFQAQNIKWQGVLHSAKIREKDDGSRVINSTCTFVMDDDETERVSSAQVETFLSGKELVAYY